MTFYRNDGILYFSPLSSCFNFAWYDCLSCRKRAVGGLNLSGNMGLCCSTHLFLKFLVFPFIVLTLHCLQASKKKKRLFFSVCSIIHSVHCNSHTGDLRKLQIYTQVEGEK